MLPLKSNLFNRVKLQNVFERECTFNFLQVLSQSVFKRMLSTEYLKREKAVQTSAKEEHVHLKFEFANDTIKFQTSSGNYSIILITLGWSATVRCLFGAGSSSNIF